MSASRAYRLRKGRPLPDEIVRVARGRIDHALDELRGKTDSTPAEAVHEARKDMKKLRALLRLARGELGDETFARENACYRDAARELSGTRDSDVMLETLDALDLPAGVAWGLRKAIQAERDRGVSDDRDAAAGVAVATLGEARGRVRGWPLERDSFEALAEGLERTFRRGRRNHEAALDDPSAEALHELRKRAKDLWYQHTLMRELWPPVMTALGDEAHALSDRLGDDHDLVVLAAWVRGHVEAPPEFSEAVSQRRGQLQQEASALAARLYAEKPSAYVRRLEQLWSVSEARVRAP